ncbi:MAG: hypothetical protein Q9200_004950 [Gallowayella weberi]
MDAVDETDQQSVLAKYLIRIQPLTPIGAEITKKVPDKASGSFLGVRLALETLERNWHTEDDIRRILQELCNGRENFYIAMLPEVESQTPQNLSMVRRIHWWVACAWGPLSLAKLETPLQLGVAGLTRLKETVVNICDHFVSVQQLESINDSHNST